VLVLGQYNHSDVTLRYLGKTLKTFYFSKSVFRPYRITKPRERKFQKQWSKAQEEARSKGQRWTDAQKARKKEQLEREVFHFAFPKMHLPSHIEESIRRMGSPDNFTTDISELLHVENIKEAYRASNRVGYIPQMLWHNDRTTSLAYMKQTLAYLAIKGFYDEDTASVLGMQNKKGLYCKNYCQAWLTEFRSAIFHPSRTAKALPGPRASQDSSTTGTQATSPRSSTEASRKGPRQQNY
jgi:hypothetical protein